MFWILDLGISIHCNFFIYPEIHLLVNYRKPFGNVNRWFTTIINQPQVKKVIGSVKLAEKMAQFDAKKFAEIQKESGAGGSAKKEKKEKKPQPPKQEKKKKESPAPEEDEPLLGIKVDDRRLFKNTGSSLNFSKPKQAIWND